MSTAKIKTHRPFTDFPGVPRAVGVSVFVAIDTGIALHRNLYKRFNFDRIADFERVRWIQYDAMDPAAEDFS
jgi:hypothetical protein